MPNLRGLLQIHPHAMHETFTSRMLCAILPELPSRHFPRSYIESLSQMKGHMKEDHWMKNLLPEDTGGFVETKSLVD